MSDPRLSIAQHYHERTKYDPETISSKNRRLDWENQPMPYKEYKVGANFDLKPYLRDDFPGLATEADKSWRRLSRLLLCSYGLTARMETMMGSPVYLRAAPSAGGLYPAEVYVISRGTSLLPSGIYNYQCRTHSLIHFWASEVWQGLQDACFGHSVLEKTDLAIIVTTIFYRSAWRYEDRAYRRIFLDTGHLLGNIELASALNGYRSHLIGGFVDRKVNDLLYLDPELEGAIAVVPLTDCFHGQDNPSSIPTALPSATQLNYPKVPDGELLLHFHRATQIEETKNGQLSKILDSDKSRDDKYNFPFCTKVSTATIPINWGEKTEEGLAPVNLEDTILKRRSTRAYNGANLTFNELNSLLNFTYQPQDYIPQGLDGEPDYFDLSLIETFIAVSGVNGLEEGCYYYAPKAQELRQIRFKNFRRELHYLCLGQDLGRDAGVVLFHTADLRKAVGKYGDRVYRYLHMDAGHLGQRLNLAAIYLGLGVSGIGGFFDDRVNEVLGIPPDEAVLYVTTLGRPRRG
ncbi:MAG TPA: SagB-type dehydrogenase domain-containing protein [Cyanobacteria bacterium UBA11149]|nr:SagB-type dehydrogenase domain-containing protein [Cyanobacteria bacterium UBA11367]HBE59189.1 SagB-type dehydrogenase domain-containing protein [Cyanobacteria bacterium UBA11366]HBK62601.1 SagB-type dehydrogenase domain-containing protein [Cyanobacteria bacterium UBA11166]HBR72526.1 SagB-type dehydrogenase domain-containing protein [Cyanobacteria bacterium UBA11159]HBS69487.1 SagB-type dehydrogenase domain-containing protein [Cyanobacteria bacterium UBA11153]HBW89239.1 SagB-type dehydrogen